MRSLRKSIMIIEFVGPSASGKSTIIQNLKENCKLDLLYQSDINLSTFKILTSFFNLKVIIEIYLRIFFTTNLTFSNKQFYSRHITKKIIYFKNFYDSEKAFIPDEGLINIYLSVLSLHNISIFKIIEKYIDFNNYYCKDQQVDTKKLNERIIKRGPPKGWDNRNLIVGNVNREDIYYKIQEKFLMLSDEFFQHEEIKFYLLENNSDLKNTTTKAKEIIEMILN